MTFTPPTELNLAAIRFLEEEIMDICNHCTTLEELQSAGQPVWDWACHYLHQTPHALRHDIETHEADEQFPTPFLEEKDHLLKIPLILLEKFHSV